MYVRFVIARGANKRPTLQHAVGATIDWTLCGRYIGNWSRAYQNEAIPAVLCNYCKNLGGK